MDFIENKTDRSNLYTNMCNPKIPPFFHSSAVASAFQILPFLRFSALLADPVLTFPNSITFNWLTVLNADIVSGLTTAGRATSPQTSSESSTVRPNPYHHRQSCFISIIESPAFPLMSTSLSNLYIVDSPAYNLYHPQSCLISCYKHFEILINAQIGAWKCI